MKALVGGFNQDKALVGAFSVLVQFHRLIVYSTSAGAHLHIHPGNVLPPAAEAPADDPGELVVAAVLADQRTSAVTLTQNTNKYLLYKCLLLSTLNFFAIIPD